MVVKPGAARLLFRQQTWKLVCLASAGRCYRVGVPLPAPPT